MDDEIERYINEQLNQIAEIMMNGGADDFDSYNQYVGLARAYRDVRAHIRDLRERRARGEDDEETTHDSGS